MDGEGDQPAGRVGSHLWQGGVSHPRVRASHDGRPETHPVARIAPRQTEAPLHTMYHNSYPCEGALPKSGIFPSIPSGTSIDTGNNDPVHAPELLPRDFFEKGKHVSPPEQLFQPPRSKQVDISFLQRPVDPPPTKSAAMVSLPQEESSDSDQPNSRRGSARRAHAAYLSEMKNAHTEGRRARHIIQTNEQSIIIGLRTKWHGAVKALARREIDFRLRNYNDHPMAWSIVMANIQRELNRMFVFQETEVMPGYLEKYLKDSLAKDRHKWCKHYMLNWQRHKKCPVQYFDAWRSYWDSEEGQMESQRMTEKRARGVGSGKECARGGTNRNTMTMSASTMSAPSSSTVRL